VHCCTEEEVHLGHGGGSAFGARRRRDFHVSSTHARPHWHAATDGTQHTSWHRALAHWPMASTWQNSSASTDPFLSLLCGLTLNLDGLWGSGY